MELDEITPEWERLDQWYKETQAKADMTAEEYQNLQYMKNLEGDPEWDVIKQYLAMGEKANPQ